jgi:fibronectin type 3 domain-containing protein
MTADWNITEKLETVSKGSEGNVRLKKVLFDKTPAKVVNPKSYFDYEIHVPDGRYRIRAKVGDVELPSWQKVVFEGVETNLITNEKGQFSWTPERIVKVVDGRLTIRIYFDETSGKAAGLSEIVFQLAG